MSKYQTNINPCIAISGTDINDNINIANQLTKEAILDNINLLAKHDKGLEMAIKGNYLQEINKSVENNGITLSIEGAIIDNKRLTISYSIKSEENYPLTLGSFNITDNQGNYINAYKLYSSSNNNDLRDNNSFVTLIMDDDINTFPQNITLSCSSLELNPCALNSKVIPGTWNVDFTINTLKYNVMPKQYNINKLVALRDMSFKIDYIKMYPTVIDIKITMDKDNPYRFVDFKNLNLKDEMGNFYSWYGLKSTISEDEMVLHFESSFFTNSKELYLSFDDIYCMPKEDKYVVYDIASHTLVDNGGYDITIYNSRDNVKYKDRDFDLFLSLRVKDKDILMSEQAFIEFKNTALNELSQEISITSKQIYTPSNKKLINDVFIEKLGDSQQIKLKIEGVSAGIMEEAEIKLF